MVIMVALAALAACRGLQVLSFTLRWPQSLTPDATLLHFDAWSLLQGKVAYRDMYSINLPVTHAIHALGIKIFGADDVGMRLLNIFLLCSLCVLTALYLRRHSTLSAILSIPAILTLTVDMGTFGQLQRETLLLPFWLGMLWISESVVAQKVAPWKGWALFGLLSGLACFIKPQSVLFSGLLIGYWAFEQIRAKADLGNVLRKWILLPGAFSLSGLLFIAFLPVILAGYSPDYLINWARYFQMYAGAGNTSVSFFFALMAQPFALWPGDFLMAFGEPAFRGGRLVVGTFTLLHLLSLGLYLTFCVKNRKPFPLLFVIVAGYLSFLLHRRGFAYHLIGMWYGFNLVLVVAIGELARIRDASQSTWRGKAATFGPGLAALILAALLCGKQFVAERNLRSAGFGHLLRPVKAADFHVVETIGAVAEDLRAKRGSTRVTIQILELHAMALASVLRYNLEGASSYMQADPLYLDYPWRDEHRRAFMDQLLKNPPDIIVLEGFEMSEKLDPFPEFARLVTTSYTALPRLREPYWVLVRK